MTQRDATHSAHTAGHSGDRGLCFTINDGAQTTEPAGFQRQRFRQSTRGSSWPAAVTRLPALALAIVAAGVLTAAIARAHLALPVLNAWLQWAFPGVQALGAFLIGRKLTWRCHPALVTFLLIQCYASLFTSLGWTVRYAVICIQLLALSALLLEMEKLSRGPLHRRVKASLAGLVISACAFHAASIPWDLDYQLSLFRSDFRIAAAAAAVSITVYRWRRPALETHAECRRHRIYRVGVTMWLVISAVSGSFVQGGIGVRLWAYTPWRWSLISCATYGALIAVVIALSVALNSSAPGRKHAAKRCDGKTVTGLLETERAA